MRSTADRGDISKFLELQNSADKEFYARVFVDKRYWDTDNYILVGSDVEISQYLTENAFSSLNLEYDHIIGDWRLDNTSIRLRNPSRMFSREGSFWSGYIPEFSKVIIEAGYVDSNGNQHGVKIFNGYIQENGIVDNFDDETVTLNIKGGSVLLDMYSAEDLPDNNEEGETLYDLNQGEWASGTAYLKHDLVWYDDGEVKTYKALQASTGENPATAEEYWEEVYSGTPANKEFRTKESTVGSLKVVYDDGERVLPGRDFEISNLNVKDDYALITFNELYEIQGVITADYIHWYTDVTIHFLVEKVLDHASITDRIVQKVEFPTYVTISPEIKDDADFNAGDIENGVVEEDKLKKEDWVYCRNQSGIKLGGTESKTRNIITASGPWSTSSTEHGLVEVLLYTDTTLQGEFINRVMVQAYYTDLYDTSGGGIKIVVEFEDSTTEEEEKAAQKDSYGSLSFTISNTNKKINNIKVYAQMYIQPGTGDSVSVYAKDLQPRHIHYDRKTQFSQSFTAKQTANIKDVAVYVRNYDEGYETVKISLRTSAFSDILEEKTVNIYQTGWNYFGGFNTALTAGETYYLGLDVADNYIWGAGEQEPYDEGIDIAIADDSIETETFNTEEKMTFDDTIINTESSNASTMGMAVSYGKETLFVSDSIDMGEDLVSIIGISRLLSGSKELDFKMYTRTQDADSGWPVTFNESDWEEVENEVVVSDVKRYIKIAVMMDLQPSTHSDYISGDQQIYLDLIRLTYSATVFEISVADLTGLTVKGVILNLAEMCDYAFGFRHDDKFFFRAKVFKDSPDILIADHTDIRNYEIDWDRIINRVSTTHGGYTAMLDSKTEDSDRPDSIDKYGIRPVSLSFSPIVGDPDADIAFGISNLYWQKYGELLPEEEAKKHFELSVLPKFGLELGDVIRVDKYPGAYPNLRRYSATLTYTEQMQYKEAPPYGSLAYLGRISIDLNRFNMELTAREL